MIRRAFLNWLTRWINRQNNGVRLPDGTRLHRMSEGFSAWTYHEGWRQYLAECDRAGVEV